MTPEQIAREYVLWAYILHLQSELIRRNSELIDKNAELFALKHKDGQP